MAIYINPTENRDWVSTTGELTLIDNPNWDDTNMIQFKFGTVIPVKFSYTVVVQNSTDADIEYALLQMASISDNTLQWNSFNLELIAGTLAAGETATLTADTDWTNLTTDSGDDITGYEDGTLIVGPTASTPDGIFKSITIVATEWLALGETGKKMTAGYINVPVSSGETVTQTVAKSGVGMKATATADNMVYGDELTATLDFDGIVPKKVGWHVTCKNAAVNADTGKTIEGRYNLELGCTDNEPHTGFGVVYSRQGYMLLSQGVGTQYFDFNTHTVQPYGNSEAWVVPVEVSSGTLYATLKLNSESYQQTAISDVELSVFVTEWLEDVQVPVCEPKPITQIWQNVNGTAKLVWENWIFKTGNLVKMTSNNTPAPFTASKIGWVASGDLQSIAYQAFDGDLSTGMYSNNPIADGDITSTLMFGQEIRIAEITAWIGYGGPVYDAEGDQTWGEGNENWLHLYGIKSDGTQVLLATHSNTHWYSVSASKRTHVISAENQDIPFVGLTCHRGGAHGQGWYRVYDIQITKWYEKGSQEIVKLGTPVIELEEV